MRAADGFKLVLSSLRFTPKKSALTALGIAIGITAVTLLTSLGEGVRHYAMSNFTQFGTRILAISPGKSETAGMGGLLSSVRLLTVSDARALQQLSGVDYVVSNVQGSGAVRFQQRQRHTEILGTNADFAAAWSFSLASGRFLPKSDSNSPPFAVLGHKVKTELFRQHSALGQFIRIGGQRFRVIGVMQPKGTMLGFDLDDMVYIPDDRALTLFNRAGLMEIDVVFSASTTAATVSQRVTDLLIRRHGQEDFTIITQDEMLYSLNSILHVLTLGVAALGSISLLVGGIGIFTIMTTNVRERTAEIGLLRAIGMAKHDLLLLFLAEAMMLSLLGGVTGILVTVSLIAFGVILLPDFPVLLSPFYLIMSLLFSALIGLLAGIAPAWQAAQLHPIEALRAE